MTVPRLTTSHLKTPRVIQRLFDWKVRGVRWVEIIGMICVAAMVFSVYIAKTAAAREGSRIGQLESQIAENRQRVRLLRAEIARLEQPGRLEALSRAAGLAPVDVRRQATEAQLTQLKPPHPAPVPVAVPVPRPPASLPLASAPPAAAPVAAPVVAPVAKVPASDATPKRETGQ